MRLNLKLNAAIVMGLIGLKTERCSVFQDTNYLSLAFHEGMIEKFDTDCVAACTSPISHSEMKYSQVCI